MLQALLKERFQLRLTRETRVMSGYIMTVQRGARLPILNTSVPPDSSGVVQMGGGEFWARGVTMNILARALGIELESPVVD
jgi:uncharacterized protein (TIGR03435 family)